VAAKLHTIELRSLEGGDLPIQLSAIERTWRTTFSTVGGIHRPLIERCRLPPMSVTPGLDSQVDFEQAVNVPAVD
jgi:hypothetical protein